MHFLSRAITAASCNAAGREENLGDTLRSVVQGESESHGPLRRTTPSSCPLCAQCGGRGVRGHGAPRAEPGCSSVLCSLNSGELSARALITAPRGPESSGEETRRETSAAAGAPGGAPSPWRCCVEAEDAEGSLLVWGVQGPLRLSTHLPTEWPAWLPPCELGRRLGTRMGCGEYFKRLQFGRWLLGLAVARGVGRDSIPILERSPWLRGGGEGWHRDVLGVPAKRRPGPACVPESPHKDLLT